MKNFIFIILSMIISLSACTSGGQKDNSCQDVGIKVIRYDRLQYEATVMNSFSALQKMNMEYPRMTKLMIEDITGVGRVDDDDINDRMCAFFSGDTTLQRLMVDALEKFNDMSGIERQLTNGFCELKEEVPAFPVPRVYSLISALNQSIVVGDSLLGISIDKYMGADYPLYKRFYYAHQRRTMTPERIVPDCFTFYLYSLYPFRWSAGPRTLYNVLLHRGKINWVVKQLLDEKSDEASLGYTKKEMEWCKKNGKALWKRMKEQDILSTTDPMVIRAFTHNDPMPLFIGEYDKSMPAAIGEWFGMKLIDKYMKRHSKLSLGELLDTTDFGTLDLD